MMQRWTVGLLLAGALTLGFFYFQPIEASPTVPSETEVAVADAEVCDKSLGGWENAQSAAESKAMQACQAQGCTGIEITGGRFYRDGDWYVYCVTYKCTGCGGGGGPIATPAEE